MIMFILMFFHLICAIFFVGYVFFDVFMCKNIKNLYEFKKLYFKSSGIIYGVIFVILIITGIFLSINKDFYGVTKYIFYAKILLIIFMIIITVFSVYYARVKKDFKHFLVKHAHLLALILCFLIVILAKLLTLSI